MVPPDHQNFYMALRALIALTDLAPALSAPSARSSPPTREYDSETMSNEVRTAYISVVTDLIDKKHQARLKTLNVAELCVLSSLQKGAGYRSSASCKRVASTWPVSSNRYYTDYIRW